MCGHDSLWAVPLFVGNWRESKTFSALREEIRNAAASKVKALIEAVVANIRAARRSREAVLSPRIRRVFPDDVYARMVPAPSVRFGFCCRWIVPLEKGGWPECATN